MKKHETPGGIVELALDALHEGLLSLDAERLDGQSWADELLAHATRRPATPEELLLAREAVVERVLSGLGAMAGPARSAVTPVGLIRRTRRDRRGERSAKMLTRRGKGEYKNSGCAR